MSYKVNFIWTQDLREMVVEQFEQWVRDNATASTHGEGIMQDDDCQLSAPELLANIVDVLRENAALEVVEE